MALCNTEIKNQVKPLSEFNNMDKKLDSMTWIKAIRMVNSGTSNNLHAKHNKAMTHISLMSMYQEKFQDFQDFRDQYMALDKVCPELALRFQVMQSRCNESNSDRRHQTSWW